MRNLTNAKNTADNREQKRNNIFVEQINTMKDSIDSLLKQIENGLQAQFSASEQLINQGKELQTSVDFFCKSKIQRLQQR